LQELYFGLGFFNSSGGVPVSLREKGKKMVAHKLKIIAKIKFHRHTLQGLLPGTGVGSADVESASQAEIY